MNIDFIKWLIEYAKGFEWEKRDYHELWYIKLNRRVIYQATANNDMRYFAEDEDFYPLLLQRAIEGINLTEESDFDIDQYGDCIEVGCYSDGNKDLVIPLGCPVKITFDQAKEEALKYIWEQEK